MKKDKKPKFNFGAPDKGTVDKIRAVGDPKKKLSLKKK